MCYAYLQTVLRVYICLCLYVCLCVCLYLCVCLEYMRDAYLQPERLMLVHRAVIADTNDHHVSLASSTLAKLSPPTKRTGLSLSLYVFVCLSLSVSVYLCLCLCVCLYVCVCLSLSVSVCLWYLPLNDRSTSLHCLYTISSLRQPLDWQTETWGLIQNFKLGELDSDSLDLGMLNPALL